MRNGFAVTALVCAIVGFDAYVALNYFSSQPADDTEVASLTYEDFDDDTYLLDDGLLASGGEMSEANENHKTLPLVYDVPGIDSPELPDAGSAELLEQSRVIGVEINGQPYAFSMDAMLMETHHIVNLVADDKAFSVVYCPLADCARVLTSEGSDLIPMRLGGLNEDGLMAVLLNGDRYDLDSARIPLSDYAFERTSYGQWKQKYPQTKVFTGQGAPNRTTSI